MEFKDYEQLGKLLKEVQRIMRTYEFILPGSAPINTHFQRAEKHLNELKRHLTQMLLIQYPASKGAL